MLTGLSTFLLLTLLASVAACWYYAQAAREAAKQLTADRGTLVRLDGELAALEAIVKSVRGRVYAQQGHARRRGAATPDDDAVPGLDDLGDADDEFQAALALQAAAGRKGAN